VRSAATERSFFGVRKPPIASGKALVRRILLVAVAMLPFGLSLTACGDTLGIGDATILSDSSVDLGVPTVADSLPSAMDLPRFLLRRPELITDAQEWDFALRRTDGALRLIPSPFSTGSRRPLIARTSQSFGDIERAPTARNAYGDTAVTLSEGAVYVMRSRHYTTSVGGTCYVFAKLRVRSLDVAGGTASLHLQVNPGCADDRLEE
jgi:hypothetical protein